MPKTWVLILVGARLFLLFVISIKVALKYGTAQRQVISVVISGSGSQEFDLPRDLLSRNTVVVHLGPEITRSTYPN